MGIMVRDIYEKALDLGYEKCGIIPIETMRGYGERMRERVERVPEAEKSYRNQMRFLRLEEDYPWAKSIIVCVGSFVRYNIPEQLEGRIGKHYLFDARNANTAEYQRANTFDVYLQGLGLRIESERKFGNLGMRWAAMQAGLGVILKNNFFYTESGSYVFIEAWLIDHECERVETPHLPPCPAGCSAVWMLAPPAHSRRHTPCFPVVAFHF